MKTPIREPEKTDGGKAWTRPVLTVLGDARVLTMFQFGAGRGPDPVYGRGALSGGGPAHS